MRQARLAVRIFPKRLLLAAQSWLYFWKNEPDERGRVRWPLQVIVRETSTSTNDDLKYKVLLMLSRDFIVDGKLPLVEEALAKKFPEIRKRSDSRVRRLGVVQDVPGTRVVEEAAKLYRTATKALEEL